MIIPQSTKEGQAVRIFRNNQRFTIPIDFPNQCEIKDGDKVLLYPTGDIDPKNISLVYEVLARACLGCLFYDHCHVVARDLGNKIRKDFLF